jgi:hypothetical protein
MQMIIFLLGWGKEGKVTKRVDWFSLFYFFFSLHLFYVFLFYSQDYYADSGLDIKQLSKLGF